MIEKDHNQNKKLLAPALISMLLLSACAQQHESSRDAGIEAAASVSEADYVDNPAQLLSETQQQLEQSRQLVKAATVRFEVENIEKTTAAIEQQLVGVGGYVEARTMHYQVENYQRLNQGHGQLNILEKIVPTSSMVVRVPNAEVGRFLNALPAMMKYFDQQSYEAKRYELKLLEQKLETASQSQEVSDATDQQLQILSQQEAQDRLKYSTIDLHYFQSPQLRQRQDLDFEQAVEQHQAPFTQRIGLSMQAGFEGFKNSILWLFYIWPFYIVLLLAYLLFRFVRKKIKQRKQRKTLASSHANVIETSSHPDE
ncbi:protein of unknown function [Acinetobacter marinus]|uniref:DUF4349 domain-containing protein n=2 Tax=Acinetobacter marinus TaxID=281375 RepID=A0A1G6GRW6_9GAMM|nr:protein of unknown function [Acinetobacter marinus]